MPKAPRVIARWTEFRGEGWLETVQPGRPVSCSNAMAVSPAIVVVVGGQPCNQQCCWLACGSW
jgi:hypothetical protein